MYEVHFRRQFTDAQPEITTFDNPQDALAHAKGYFSEPYYMVRLHEVGSEEWLTYAQLDLRLNGGLMPRADRT